MSIENNAVQLMRFPYPFKAGLSICSDIDKCSMANFINIHKFINSKKYGIGLPIADSFFGATKDSSQLAYLNLDGKERFEESEFIRQSIRDGLIDSLHSWGDFNEFPPSKDIICNISRKLTDSFIKHGIRIPIWINHGSSNNWQNLYSRIHFEYQGDNKESPVYSVDFIKKIGIKYFWDSELVKWPLSIQNPKKKKVKRRIYLNMMKNLIKMALNKSVLMKSSNRITQLASRTILRDGNALIAFNRFADHPDKEKRWMADRESLRYSLSERVLDELIEDEGYLIIYTHLGKPLLSNLKKENIFHKEDEQALIRLFDLYQKKHIWVTPTSSLLKFKIINDHIKWKVINDNEDVIINIESIDDPVYGIYKPLPEDLSGICFYSSTLDKTFIQIDGRKVPAYTFSKDEKGGGWIGFDIPKEPKTQLVE